jgi:hypothetical protein
MIGHPLMDDQRRRRPRVCAITEVIYLQGCNYSRRGTIYLIYLDVIMAFVTLLLVNLGLGNPGDWSN